MNHPKISIVTVSYNQAPYLEEAMRSVLDQDYPNLEYIVIDGGSTDGSVDIIRKFEKQLAYWTSEKDAGMYDGLQKGLARCTGEIMAWINSDDMFHPKSFYTVAEIFSALPEVKWLQGIPTVIDESGRTVYVKNFRQWSKYNYFLKDTEHIQQESTFWRRSLWDAAGAKLDTTLKLAGDYELWLRFFDHAPLHCVRTMLGAFRMRAKNQLSVERMDEYNREVAAALNKRMAALSAEERNVLNAIAERNQPAGIFSKRRKTATSIEQLYQYPPAISYNRERQIFVLEK